MDRLLSGIVLTILAGTCFALMDAVGKQLTAYLSVIMVVWGRYFFQTAISAGILSAMQGAGFLKTRRPLVQFLRGAALFCATLLMYSALAHIPLADATSALFFTPILVALFSAVFLKERIGLHRIGAILAGFAGVLLVVRPGSAGTSIYLILPVGAACMNATYLILTSLLSGEQERRAAQFHTTSVGAIVLTFAVIPGWRTPEPVHLAALAMMGLLGVAGHFSLVVAMRHAPASLLSPYLYSQVVAAMLLSVMWFGDRLVPATLIGTALLVGSGIYIWWRERIVRQAR
jgi:drug/metabolite transporter (DMT)-like permease